MRLRITSHTREATGARQSHDKRYFLERRAQDVQAPADKNLWAAPVRQLDLGCCVVDTRECCLGFNVITAVEFPITGGPEQSFQQAHDTQLFWNKVSDVIALQNEYLDLIS